LDKPTVYIKDREITYLLGLKQKGATHWITNLGFEKEEGDIGLYTEEQVRQMLEKQNAEPNQD